MQKEASVNPTIEVRHTLAQRSKLSAEALVEGMFHKGQCFFSEKAVDLCVLGVFLWHKLTP